MTETERYREDLRRGGIRDGSKLFPILVAAHDAARAAEVAVRDGARGLSPEGEKQLADRVAHDMVSRAERLFDRRVSWLSLRTSLAAATVLVMGMAGTGAVGGWLGERSGLAQSQDMAGGFRDFLASDPAGAAVVLRLVRYNDFAKAEKSEACQKTLREVRGGRACDMPLWLERVGQPGR